MEELYQKSSGEHKLMLENRGGLSVSGVVDIISFDLNEVLMETSAGMLTVRGQDLHINKLVLEKGEADLSGTVDSLLYADLTTYGEKAGSFFKRLFQ